MSRCFSFNLHQSMPGGQLCLTRLKHTRQDTHRSKPGKWPLRGPAREHSRMIDQHPGLLTSCGSHA